MSKIALITGSRGNLGKAVTKKMKVAGFTVIGTVEPGKENLGSEKNEFYKTVDLFDARSTEILIQEVKSTHGSIDAAVCLAGGFSMGDLLETTPEDLGKMLDLNFFTAFNVIRPVLNIMKHQSELGRIVLVGAKPVFDLSAAGSMFSYSLSKSMTIKLADIINANSKKYNAVASVIVPSIIDTPANREAMPDAEFTNWVSPESIAENIAFVCGDGGKDREGDSESLSQTPKGDAPLQIEHRPAELLAAGVRLAEAHAEDCLGVLGGHPHESGYPHPEQGPRPSRGDRGRDPDDVPRPDGGGQRGHQSLEVGYVSIGPRLVPLDEGQVDGVAELSELQSAKQQG